MFAMILEFRQWCGHEMGSSSVVMSYEEVYLEGEDVTEEGRKLFSWSLLNVPTDGTNVTTRRVPGANGGC